MRRASSRSTQRSLRFHQKGQPMRIPSALVLAALLSSTTCLMSGNAQVDKPVERKHPVLLGPSTGGVKDVTGSNDAQVLDVTEFAVTHLESENTGLHYTQYKVEVQVVAGLKYYVYFNGTDDKGTCQEKRKVVVYDKPWMKTRDVESDETLPCA